MTTLTTPIFQAAKGLMKGFAGAAVALGLAVSAPGAMAAGPLKTVKVGGDITVTDNSEDGIVTIGGDITINGSAGDLAIMGGDILIQGTIKGDVAGLGGDVTVDGHILGDFAFAGGQITFTPTAKIDGDAAGAAGTIEMKGAIGGDAAFGGDEVIISGRIDGNLEVRGNDLIIKPGAVISGTIEFEGPQAPVIEDGATVSGEVTHTFAPRGDIVMNEFVAHGGLAFLIAIAFVSVFLLLLGGVVLGAILVFGLPNFTERAVQTFKSRPVSSFLLGFLTVVAVPALTLFLFVSIIGIPLAFIVSQIYPVIVTLGLIMAAIAFYRIFGKGRPGKWAQFGLLLLGTLTIALLLFIPLLGWLALAVLFFMGTGAFVLAFFPAAREADAAAA